MLLSTIALSSFWKLIVTYVTRKMAKLYLRRSIDYFLVI
jgi:hypothetical protein